jgi:hypothetical protein
MPQDQPDEQPTLEEIARRDLESIFHPNALIPVVEQSDARVMSILDVDEESIWIKWHENLQSVDWVIHETLSLGDNLTKIVLERPRRWYQETGHGFPN